MNETVIAVLFLILGFGVGWAVKTPESTIVHTSNVGKVIFQGYADRHSMHSKNQYNTDLFTKDKEEALLKLSKINGKRYYDDMPQGTLVELYYKDVE